jgi:hypothetical protein
VKETSFSHTFFFASARFVPCFHSRDIDEDAFGCFWCSHWQYGLVTLHEQMKIIEGCVHLCSCLFVELGVSLQEKNELSETNHQSWWQPRKLKKCECARQARHPLNPTPIEIFTMYFVDSSRVVKRCAICRYTMRCDASKIMHSSFLSSFSCRTTCRTNNGQHTVR